ncbi:MAG: membrane bound O-acyl transferase family-domain-containing protein [Aureispira sp.]|nr:membrane bound O-acyl transferase family-domain-containing protein [Aureispira sp.]
MDLTLLLLLSWGILLLIIGYALCFIQNKKLARLLSWGIIISTTIFSVLVSQDKPALYRMITIVSLQLISMKSIVMVETYSGKPQLTIFQWLCFATTWFGMRPKLFEALVSKPLDGIGALLFKSLSRIAFGFFLLFISTKTEELYIDHFYISDLLMLAGMSFILHFGILNLSTLAWRIFGVNLNELFISPYKSKSLKEFWGKRWNMAFSEMTSLIVYKPLIGKVGKATAMIAAFLVSGILHEIAISLPAQAGYGLPLLFFVIHAIGMTLERQVNFVKTITEHKIYARIWVYAWLLLPMPLLFHPSFLELVIRPLRAILLGFWS